MTFTQRLQAAAIAYEYSDEDKSEMRRMALEDREGLHKALELDPWLPWVAYEHGIIDTPLRSEQ